MWITVAVGAVAAATFTQRVRVRWYGWFCTIAAVLGVLAVIDTVSTSTGGIFANAALAVGVVPWAAVTSIVMVWSSSQPQK
jgi:drug/metabolite transporter (DMT)-like permease